MRIFLLERYSGMFNLILYGFIITVIFCIPVAFFSTSDYILQNIITIEVGFVCSILIFVKTKTILSKNTNMVGLTSRLIVSNMITYTVYLVMISTLYILFDKSVFLVVFGVIAYKLSLIINVIKGGVSIE